MKQNIYLQIKRNEKRKGKHMNALPGLASRQRGRGDRAGDAVPMPQSPPSPPSPPPRTHQSRQPPPPSSPLPSNVRVSCCSYIFLKGGLFYSNVLFWWNTKMPLRLFAVLRAEIALASNIIYQKLFFLPWISCINLFIYYIQYSPRKAASSLSCLVID